MASGRRPGANRLSTPGGAADPLAALLSTLGLPGRLALCLDYDGTVAPIVPDPDRANPLPGMLPELTRLAGQLAAVALISGRPAAWLAQRVPVAGVRCVGLYGLEESLDGRLTPDPAARAWAPAVRAALGELRDDPEVVSSAAFVEDKGLGVAVHLRRIADPGRWSPRLERVVRRVGDAHHLDMVGGRLVWELRPPVPRDKGGALRRVVDESNAGAVLIAGDDLGDLAAFRAAGQLHATGLGAARVAVASAEAPAELLAAADVVVDGPAGVLALLRRLAPSRPAD